MRYIFQNTPVNYLQSVHAGNFDEISLQLFHYQYETNHLYKSFSDLTGKVPALVKSVLDIPYLPVSFFKTHQVVSGNLSEHAVVFSSSTTTSDIPGKHYVTDMQLYNESLLSGFRQFYGEPQQYTFLALLPSYLQRKGASLVHMADELMSQSNKQLNGFYLDEFDKLATVLQQLEEEGSPVILLGVTFALLDFAEAYPMQLKNTIVMETGGMKGRRKELTRGEVHDFLKQQLGVSSVHSEYGMTELLSQAYAVSDGMFRTANSMKVFARDINDPFDVKESGTGCVNIIDLANIHSCAFLATDDVGRIYPDGSFEISGRADNSALRGCNLMVI